MEFESPLSAINKIMTKTEFDGFMIILCIAGAVLIVAFVLHEIEQRRYYKRMRLEAEQQKRDVMRQIKDGKW